MLFTESCLARLFTESCLVMSTDILLSQCIMNGTFEMLNLSLILWVVIFVFFLSQQ
jgi:hypothetical protein